MGRIVTTVNIQNLAALGLSEKIDAFADVVELVDTLS